MFDIGFSELIIIGLVALIVFGPEELPRVARTAGHLLGKLRRYVADVKADISHEMELADIKRMQQEIKDTAAELHNSLNDQARALHDEFTQVVTPGLDSVRNGRPGATERLAGETQGGLPGPSAADAGPGEIGTSTGGSDGQPRSDSGQHRSEALSPTSGQQAEHKG